MKDMKTKVKSYWEERYEKLPDYIVVSRDGDGVDIYTVVHKKHEKEFYSGFYSSEIHYGFSMSKSEKQELADKMNSETQIVKS